MVERFRLIRANTLGTSFRFPKVKSGSNIIPRKMPFLPRERVDTSPPLIDNLFPTTGSSLVDPLTNMSFDLTDNNRIDLTSLNVEIDSVPAISNGVFNPGYTGTFSAITGPSFNDGYTVNITKANLSPLSAISVQVSVSDISSNSSLVNSWSFSTSAIPPDLEDGFEFSDGWPNTVADTDPNPSFTTETLGDGFENADSWPGT